MAKGRTTEWIDPNGERHTRTSKTMHYTHLVVLETDLELAVGGLIDRAHALERRAQALEDILDSFFEVEDLAKVFHLYRRGSDWASCLYADRSAFNNDTFDNDTPYYWMPDYRNTAIWRGRADGVVRYFHERAASERERADKINAERRATGHHLAYNVHGWSQSLRGATSKLREVQRHFSPPMHRAFIAEAGEAA